MFRDLLSSRLIQVGLVFFVVVVGGSLLYSWHVHRTTVAEFAGTDVVPHQTRSEQDTVDTSTVDFEQAETPLAADDSQMSDDTDVAPIDETSEVLDMADAFLPDGFVSEAAPVEDIPVSPFGFGPYPEIPVDYPEQDIWDRIEDMTDLSLAKDNELMARVRIKLWNQGTQTVGAAYTDGKIYPVIPGVAYVTWNSVELPDGTRKRYPSRVSGTPEIKGKEHYFYQLGEAPPGITVITHEEGGIAPYEFLNLQQ